MNAMNALSSWEGEITVQGEVRPATWEMGWYPALKGRKFSGSRWKDILRIPYRGQGLSKNPVMGNEQSVNLGNQAASHSEVAKSLGFVVSPKLSITCKDHPWNSVAKNLSNAVSGPGEAWVGNGTIWSQMGKWESWNIVDIPSPSFPPTTYLLKGEKTDKQEIQGFCFCFYFHLYSLLSIHKAVPKFGERPILWSFQRRTSDSIAKRSGFHSFLC